MSVVLAIALKDLRLLFRVRSALFFTLVWPVLVAVLFGTLFGRPGDGPRSLRIAVSDADGTPGSRAFVDALAARAGLDVVRVGEADARDLVRRGERAVAVRLLPGFGAASERVLYGTPPAVAILADPSRAGESAMLQGLLLEQASSRLQTLFSDPAAGRSTIGAARAALTQAPPESVPGRAAWLRAFGEIGAALDAQAAAPAPAAGEAPGWKPLDVRIEPVTRERTGPRSGFEISFPQGILWGMLGCMMAFATSIVVERTRGTLLRLRLSPVPAWTLLAGKALACYVAIMIVQLLLAVVGIGALGLRPVAPGLLVIVSLVAPTAFVGIMMVVASLGENEQAAAGAGWAIMMPLSMVGGGMVPLMFMPGWMATLGYVSPVRWAILAYEGTIWRGFSAAELVGPCAILLAVGLASFTLGARRFARMG